MVLPPVGEGVTLLFSQVAAEDAPSPETVPAGGLRLLSRRAHRRRRRTHRRRARRLQPPSSSTSSSEMLLPLRRGCAWVIYTNCRGGN